MLLLARQKRQTWHRANTQTHYFEFFFNLIFFLGTYPTFPECVVQSDLKKHNFLDFFKIQNRIQQLEKSDNLYNVSQFLFCDFHEFF